MVNHERRVRLLREDGVGVVEDFALLALLQNAERNPGDDVLTLRQLSK